MLKTYRLLGKLDLQAIPAESGRWYIKHLLPVSGMTIIYGAPGEGKTSICLDMALALENGLPFAGCEGLQGDFPGERVGTAWLSFEDSWEQEVRERLEMRDSNMEWPVFIVRHDSEKGHWGDAVDLRLDGIFPSSGPAEIPDDVRDRWNGLGQTLQENGVRVLFIDTLSELMGSDTHPRQAQANFNLLSGLRRDYGITIVLIGHSSSHRDQNGKKKDELLGVTAFSAKARHTVLVQSNNSKTWARVHKSNRGPTGYNVTFERIGGGPVVVTGTNSQDEFVEQSREQKQNRDWEKKREQAHAVRAAGPEAWVSMKAMGEAAGGSRKIGESLVKAGFFTKNGDGYIPNDELIGESTPDNVRELHATP